MIQALWHGDIGYVLGFFSYTIVAFVLVSVVRRFKAAWAFVPAGNAEPPSRRAITLWQAVKAFLKIGSLRLLTFGVVTACLLRIAIADWTIWDVAIIAGTIAVWPFQEWFFHAYLLHLKPFILFGRKIEPIFVKTHRTHHLNPWEPGSGVVPYYFVAFYFAFLPVVWHLTLPLAQAMTGVASSLMLILFYEWVHYLIHTTYKPKRKWYARLWRNHRLHHFKNENHWYGVTTVTADIVLRTHPPKETIANSDSCLTLGSQVDREQSM